MLAQQMKIIATLFFVFYKEKKKKKRGKERGGANRDYILSLVSDKLCKRVLKVTWKYTNLWKENYIKNGKLRIYFKHPV